MLSKRKPKSSTKNLSAALQVKVAKSDTTRELDTTNLFINRSWVEVKRVRVIFGLTQLTYLLNKSCPCLTCLTRLTWLVYKGNFTILPLSPRYISLSIISSLQPEPNLTPLSILRLFVSNSSSSPQNSNRSSLHFYKYRFCNYRYIESTI